MYSAIFAIVIAYIIWNVGVQRIGGARQPDELLAARLAAEGPFDDIWVQPAAGDAGTALGAAAGPAVSARAAGDG